MEDKTKENEGDSLEGTAAGKPAAPGSSDIPAESLDGSGGASATPQPTSSRSQKKKGILRSKVASLIGHLNIYLLLFIVIVFLAGGVVFVGYQRGKKAVGTTTINTQPLTQEALNQLKESEAKVGDPKQTLTIESNAIFSGKVLIRDSLDVAGGIKVGSALALPGISVSGTSTFDQVQANRLAVNGDTTIQGQVNIQKGITVGGGASFGGNISAPQITAQSLQLLNDLQITRHIDAGGGTPGKSDGTALGSGGTVSVGGSDTAGTITINTGGGPPAGCFVTVTFAQKFGGTPHVVVSPVGSGAAGLDYYVNRNSTSFSVCATNAPPASQTFSFDYVVID
jgi:cytoskeletal protein CcmA (bactofilin family)